jgi:hypothetical protein
MSNLESIAKPILKPMMHGKQLILSRDDQLTLARWMTKSAVVYDTHTKDNEYFFSDADCHNLFTSNASPFSDSAIYLAHYDNIPNNQMFMTETRQIATPQSPDADRDLLTFQAYSATFVIKYLALQIFVINRHVELRQAGRITVGISRFWHDRTVGIWPLSDSITWPPPLALDSSSLGAFARRWQSPSVARFP